jgi:hypothetical protein
MDMIPPQAPPAVTQSTYQEAADAFNRIVGLQAWLATEQAGIPALPDTPGPGTLQPYLDAIEAYWSAPPQGSPGESSRRTAIAGRIALAARDLAVLAHEDGNLDDASLALARALVVAHGGDLPAHVTVRELMFGETAYAGALLVQNEQVPDRILVFSTQEGWESFPSLRDAHAEMERRARHALVTAPDLPGIARQHLVPIGPDPFVASRPIADDPFGTLVERMIGVQRDKLRQAWFEVALADDGDSRAHDLEGTVFDALRLDRVFDVVGILDARHAALVDTFNAQRLARVPANVADDWRNAEETYLSALRTAVGRETEAGLATPSSLAGYATRALGERLQALGITHDPADIQVHISRRADVTAYLESLQALFEGPAPAHIRLIDLAYQNIATFDPVRLNARTSDGAPIPALDDATIRDIVRSLDLSSRYQGYVDSTFRSGAEAAMRREHATSVQGAHMRFQAAEARLSYYLDDVPRSFRDDRTERGYQWVKAVLDAPVAAHRARVEGHEIVVRQITYQGTPLRDVLVIGVRNPGSVPRIVVYTPDAPDGITFREFDDRAAAARAFFYHPAFREYLLDRLPADYARVLPNGNAREFAGSRLANWVLGSSDSAAYTRTEAPFDERDVAGDFLAAAYEVDVQLGLRNVQTFTRSAEQANWTWLLEQPRKAMLSDIVATAVKGVVTAPVHAAQAAWRLYDSVKSGDHAQAFVDFTDFYVASLNVVPMYALGTAPRAIVGARFRAAGRLVEAGPAMQPVVVFESRFAANGVRKTGSANREGIFTIDGKTYIEHDSQLYGVRYDIDYGTWRLTRPNGGALAQGPAIQRTTAGSWTHRRVGLPGGSGRGPAGSPDRLPDLYDEYQAEIELAFTDPVERELVAARMRIERTALDQSTAAPTALVTLEQRVRWNVALGRARARRASRTSQPGTSVQGPALDLTLSSSPYGGFRQVSRAQAPEELWYYGKVPFKNSALQRHRGNPGYSRDMAEITHRFIDQGTYGIRVTTVPPTAPIEEIRLAMGAPDLARSTTFSVRIDPNSLYEPMSDIWRKSYWLAGDTPNATLLAANSGMTNVFFVRSAHGQSLKLGTNQFLVNDTLPPSAPRP